MPVRRQKLVPNEFQTTIRLAETFTAGGQYQEALDVYDHLPAIAENSSNKTNILHWYYRKTGEMYVALSKFKEAAACYDKDLPLWGTDYGSYETLEQLSAIHYQQRQYALAKPYLQRIIEQWPDTYPRAYTSMAMFYLEAEEDAENALNYLMKAAQVNRQTPERIGGIDAEIAANINGLIGMVYYKKLNDEEKAIQYYETALLCKPSKEVEAEICTALYDIYKKNGNEERAAELKDKRLGPVMLLDLFNGPPPPRPSLHARLGNPKNTQEEIEKLPYYYKNLPEDSTERFKYLRHLEEEFYEDLLNNPAYKEYFKKYFPFEVKKFAYEYVKHKESLLNLARWVMDPNESGKEKELHYFTDKIFKLILQKKLWNMQLQWRAEDIEIPGVDIAYDFEVWSYKVMQCPFIEVTPGDIEVMKEFLMDDYFYDDIQWLVGWQQYEKLMHQNEEEQLTHCRPGRSSMMRKREQVHCSICPIFAVKRKMHTLRLIINGNANNLPIRLCLLLRLRRNNCDS